MRQDKRSLDYQKAIKESVGRLGELEHGGGSSWATAFTNLQDALRVAGSCSSVTQIWVAKGTYYPDEGPAQADNSPVASFVMKNNLAIYGGFKGTEANLAERDWKANPTILSGDIQQDGIQGNNSYHVVSNDRNNLNSTALLDGFTVTRGGEGKSDSLDVGGGMFNRASSPAIANCTFSDNASVSGGGMHNANASPTVTNCSFLNNHVVFGGGMFNFSSLPTLTNCNFSGNTADIKGGGVYNNSSAPKFTNCNFSKNAAIQAGGMYIGFGSSPSVTNCSFSGNTAIDGGGMYIFQSSPTLLNCILWGDSGGETYYGTFGSTLIISYSIVQGGCPANATCSNVLDQDPLFVDAAAGNLRLQACSPAIDAGSNGNFTAADKDLYGNPRLVHGTVDMGAYEYQGSTPTYTYYKDGDGDGYGNPAAAKETFCTTAPNGYATNNTDCNDKDNTAWRTGTFYKDADGDGYTVGSAAQLCYGNTAPTGYRTAKSATDDCNDNDKSVYNPTAYYLDADADGFGDPAKPTFVCASQPPPGYVKNSTDNCPSVYNPDQADTDGDGKGDVCDDSDGDGVVDAYDCEPLNKKGAKWLVCHNGNTLCVDKAGMQDHIAHGDKLGRCAAASNTTPAKAGEVNNLRLAESSAETSAGIYPNPTRGIFRLRLTNSKSGTAQVIVLDAKGASVQQQRVALVQGIQTLAFTLEGRAAGLYLVQVRSEGGTQTFKVFLQE